MSVLRLLARRLALGLFAAWTVLSAVWALFTLTPDWVLSGRLGMLKWGGAPEEAVDAAREQYLAARGFDRPLHEQYVDWMGDMATLNWGDSLDTGEAVFPLVLESAVRTATYVLPAIALAIVVGLVVGLYAALHPQRLPARAGIGSAYLLFAIPGFWLGGMIFSLAVGEVVAYSPLVFEHLFPVFLTTTALLGGYVSYSRAYAREVSSAEFVTVIKAKGAGPQRVAWHVLRNAAVPVVSMLFTEALALLVLAVFVVETLFGIEGFGLLLVDAIEQRDLPVLLGGTILVIAVSVVGTTLQDLSYRSLDPRVDLQRR